jgi:hypothetical protein
MGEDLPTGGDSSATIGRVASSRAQLLPWFREGRGL